MQQVLSAILPIIFAIIIGYCFGFFLKPRWRNQFIKLLTPLVWLLLASIGCEFGVVLNSPTSLQSIVKTALIFSIATTSVPWLFVMLMETRQAKKNIQLVGQQPRSLIDNAWKIIKDCGIALSMVAIGVIGYSLQMKYQLNWLWLPNSNWLLVILLFLIGIDLVNIQIKSNWLAPRMFLLPLIVIIGSWLAALILAILLDERWQVALTLSSGFGWFSLSGVLTGKILGEYYGSIALLTDLFRELFCIVLLYSLGKRYPLAAVASGAATTMDTTLPMIKQVCKTELIPVALMSGFILSLLVPICISFWLSFV